MPIHVYECKDHGRFEAFRKLLEEGVGEHPCPKCRSRSPKVWDRDSLGLIDHGFEEHWSEQLGAHITSREHEKRVIRDIYEKSEGNVALDWK